MCDIVCERSRERERARLTAFGSAKLPNAVRHAERSLGRSHTHTHTGTGHAGFGIFTFKVSGFLRSGLLRTGKLRSAIIKISWPTKLVRKII